MKSTSSMQTGSSVVCILIAITSAAFAAQPQSATPWSVLQAGLQGKRAGQRLAAVRVLGIINKDPYAAELAENALRDPNPGIRAAAATALGQMHATGSEAALKQALNDKQLSVVMAAAHALRLLNDPACYDVYYAFLTGERKNNSSMVSQQMQVFHDPKQVAAMGFNEGIGYLPFAGMGWEAVQTIMKDKKSGAAAKAALVTALATDPDPRADDVLVKETQSPKWVLRVAALEAIAKRGKPALAKDIEKSLTDSKVEVQDTAAATIIHLSNIREAHEEATQTTLLPTQSEPELWKVMSH
ncbi:MAG TPA: HEAT repeat domain-containing protein [Terriglobales bacterium]|nr:HEAT repeat domain-containing protein [Terriglobales bacterium]